MAITYSLAPVPRWFFTDNFGRPLAGGTMETYSSLDHTQPKPVYKTASNALPWDNPILFDANGMQGPFFWEFDDAVPDDGYFLVVKDSSGNLIFTEDNYFPGSGGGGGGGTTYIDLDNQIVNGSFWRNIGSTSVASTAVNRIIAPSAHEAFHEPDLRFIKNSTTAADTLEFIEFGVGDTPFGSEITPAYFLRYVCNNTPSPETIKCIQFPIISNVKNLGNQDCTFKFWARCNSGDPQVTINIYPYYGTGGVPSTSTPINIQTINLTSDWDNYEVTIPVPSTGGKTLGTNRDDALYLQFQYPLGQATSIDLSKPMFFVGDDAPDSYFETYDMVNGVISAPRTGDVRIALNSFTPFGWVPANDGTISRVNTVTPPAGFLLARGNTDTFYLYSLIWNLTSGNPNLAQIYDSSGTITTRGGTPNADFAADKQLALTKTLGRVLAGVNPITASQAFTADAATDRLTVSSVADLSIGTPIIVANSGGTLPGGLSANIVYYVTNISGVTFQIAASLEFAYAGTPIIDITSAGSGTSTLYTALGDYEGEGFHTLTIDEMPSHNHQASTTGGSLGSSLNGQYFLNVNNPFSSETIINIPPQGGGQPHNTMQPTAFLNIFFKL